VALEPLGAISLGEAPAPERQAERYSFYRSRDLRLGDEYNGHFDVLDAASLLYRRSFINFI